MARQLLLLLLAFASAPPSPGSRRGQPRRRPRGRPALLRGDAGLGPAQGLEPRSASRQLGHAQVERRRHLEVLGRGGWISTVPPPPRPASPRRSRRRESPRRPRAPRAAPRCGTPAASAPPRARAIEGRLDRRGCICHLRRENARRRRRAACLIVSVTGAAAIDAGGLGVGGEGRDQRLDQLRRQQRPGRVVDRDQLGPDRRQRVGDRLGAGGAAGDDAEVARRPRSWSCPGGRRRRSSAPTRRPGRPRSTTRSSACPPAARRPSGRRLRDAPRSRRPR